MKMRKCISIEMLLNLVAFFKLIVLMALNHLGLFKPSEHVTDSTEEQQHYTNYVVVLNHLCPSIIPVHVLTAHIKKLPVEEFGQALEKYKDEGKAIVCNICLDCIERSHEVTE
ncbi:hypothetical protein RchiOBHm_Chr7g0187721 [Rosa chinensis]|uniref:Uncharacterized protein n=1 Tax=Rosa chinensis TaxID=74649 RepID=A0A2P6P4A8_ROSCH|nr:hypothetical protein RchiOBHm_Chr7g0187721 [Rosa chinensis]